MDSVKFCFRIGKEVGLAEDNEGNPEEAYACISGPTQDPIHFDEEEYFYAHAHLRKHLARALETDIENIIKISEEEYIRETEED